MVKGSGRHVWVREAELRRLRATSVVAALLLALVASACGENPPETVPAAEDPSTVTTGDGTAATTGSETPEQPGEDFDDGNFDRSTTIDNEWFPLIPGTQFVYEGFTVEDGQRLPHRVVSTITDLTKVIGGVRTVVAWDRDYSANELVEAELALFAQDNDGNVWHLGQYPEEYEDGKIVKAPAWIAGFKGAKPGIFMRAEPQVGGSSYAQGWGPAVNWTDRARVHKMGGRTCVPFRCYEDVMVIEEFSQEEPGAFQLKYFAPGAGNVRVGWRGKDPSKETLQLAKILQLNPEALAEARAEALKLEKRAYKISKDVYAHTPPAEPLGAE